MAIADLKNVLRIFGGSDIDAGAQDELYREVLLMTLARAADADINIQSVEVEHIQRVLKEKTGDDFTKADIRIAARAELYAEANLRKYLSKVNRKLTHHQRGEIIRALRDVMCSDHEVSALEVDFFNGVADALGVTPAQVAGLSTGSV
jgi:uncharacterized tellurite resistance protein B-like protein